MTKKEWMDKFSKGEVSGPWESSQDYYDEQIEISTTAEFMYAVLPVCIQNSSETPESENKAVERALRISRIAAQRLSTYREERK